jgi:hypothetical protein
LQCAKRWKDMREVGFLIALIFGLVCNNERSTSGIVNIASKDR